MRFIIGAAIVIGICLIIDIVLLMELVIISMAPPALQLALSAFTVIAAILLAALYSYLMWNIFTSY